MHGKLAQALILWVAWRPALVALAAALLTTAAARLLRIKLLAAAAVGIGAVVGFSMLAGPWPARLALPVQQVWPAHEVMQRLAPLVAAATLAALAGTVRIPRLGGATVARAMTWGAVILGGWFLIGAPVHLWPLLRWIEAGCVATVLAAGALILPGLGAGRVVLASVSLACGLAAAHAGHGWVLAGLVPGAALLGSLALAGRLLQPAGLAVAAVASGCLLSAGVLTADVTDLYRASARPTEAAVLAPVLAVWLAGRLAPRLHLAASGIGLAAATALVWMVAGGR